MVTDEKGGVSARDLILYDRFPDDHQIDRYVSDFDCHVYYPRELELLFRMTGFSIERWFGDYAMHPLGRASRQMIAVGVKHPRRSRLVEILGSC